MERLKNEPGSPEGSPVNLASQVERITGRWARNTTATIDISFNRILSEGPEVSLNGSPTVSPTTAAL